MGKRKKYSIDYGNKLVQVFRDGTTKRISGVRAFSSFATLEDGRTVTVVAIRGNRKINDFKTHWMRLGYAICHPEDVFYYATGTQIALKRAIETEREIVSNSYSLLTDDRVRCIIDDELNYISRNLEKW